MLLHAIILLFQQSTPQAPADHREPLRRRPVTPVLMSSAFADSATRALVMLARRARSSQDSSLRGYDAKTQARLTVSLRTSALTPNKLLFRTENVSSVKWRRGRGIVK